MLYTLSISYLIFSWARYKFEANFSILVINWIINNPYYQWFLIPVTKAFLHLHWMNESTKNPFFKEVLKDAWSTGAVFPSSQSLAKKMLKNIEDTKDVRREGLRMLSGNSQGRGAFAFLLFRLIEVDILKHKKERMLWGCYEGTKGNMRNSVLLIFTPYINQLLTVHGAWLMAQGAPDPNPDLRAGPWAPRPGRTPWPWDVQGWALGPEPSIIWYATHYEFN